MILALLLLLAPAAPAKTLYTGFTALTDTQQGPRVVHDGLMLVGDDGRIEALVEGGAAGAKALRRGAKAVDLRGKWVIPGFLSGHNHLWQSPFRGLASDKTLVPWIKARVEVIKKDRVAEGDFLAFTQHGVLDLLQHGVTTVYSHAQALRDLGQYAPEQFQAECRLPQRFIYGLPAKDIAFDDAKAQLDAMKAQKQKGTCPALLGFGLSDAFFFASKIVKEPRLQEHVRIQKEFGLIIEDHFLEEFEESKSERELYHRLMNSLLEPDWGKIVIAHFIHPDEAILRHVQAKGIKMIWNPLSNGRLGSGVPRIPDYLHRGIGVGMGIDGQASGDIADPFENMRMGLYGVRAADHRSDELSPQQVFSLHTLGTARVLGLDGQVGSLEEGKAADFLVLDPDHPSTGLSNDLWAQLVFAFSTRNIESVHVGGKAVWRQGRFTDPAAAKAVKTALERAAKHLK